MNEQTNPEKVPARSADALSRLWMVWAGLGLAVLALLIVRPFNSIAPAAAEKEVIVYCAQDQEYAEPLFQEFEQETGIKVHAVFDSEAVKTVGMANRLINERRHPQCDLFWGNEELRTRQMEAADVFRLTNGWTGFGYRSRRVVINTNQVSAETAPHSLLELTNATWAGRVAIAYPQFGTTATHFHALRQHWGNALWLNWCQALVANKALLVEGNSVVVKTVGSGQAAVGISDSDDIAAGQREGLPVAALSLSEEMLLIPNTTGFVRGANHPDAADSLGAFLQRPETLAQLVEVGALEGGAISEVTQATLKVDWPQLLRDLDAVTGELNRTFLR